MFALSSVIVAICLGGLPADPPEGAPSPAAVRTAVSRKANDSKASLALSNVRKAELQKTISKRKEFRQRYRGQAYRQTTSMAPAWAATMNQMTALATAM
jgi:hypothetical protein